MAVTEAKEQTLTSQLPDRSFSPRSEPRNFSSEEPSSSSRIRCAKGFTLVELVLVILIIAVMTGVVTFSLGTFAYWREQSFIRRLSETITFLYHQAVTDQAFYRLEFSFDKEQGVFAHSYKVGVMKTEEADDSALVDLCNSQAGTLSCELASFLSPSIGLSQTIIPPPDYPSLAEKVPLPEGVYFEDIRTMRGKKNGDEGGTSFILFSPRGFSEFGVIHLRLSAGGQVTILINPFTGTTDVYKEYKDFEWQYGKKESAIKE